MGQSNRWTRYSTLVNAQCKVPLSSTFLETCFLMEMFLTYNTHRHLPFYPMAEPESPPTAVVGNPGSYKNLQRWPPSVVPPCAHWLLLTCLAPLDESDMALPLAWPTEDRGGNAVCQFQGQPFKRLAVSSPLEAATMWGCFEMVMLWGSPSWPWRPRGPASNPSGSPTWQRLQTQEWGRHLGPSGPSK